MATFQENLRRYMAEDAARQAKRDAEDAAYEKGWDDFFSWGGKSKTGNEGEDVAMLFSPIGRLIGRAAQQLGRFGEDTVGNYFRDWGRYFEQQGATPEEYKHVKKFDDEAKNWADISSADDIDDYQDIVVGRRNGDGTGSKRMRIGYKDGKIASITPDGAKPVYGRKNLLDFFQNNFNLDIVNGDDEMYATVLDQNGNSRDRFTSEGRFQSDDGSFSPTRMFQNNWRDISTPGGF